MQECEKALFEFLRDFEIFPTLINKSKVYNLWTQVTEKSLDGREPIYKNCINKLIKESGAKSEHFKIINESPSFSFGFFLDFLALIALTAYIEDEASEKVFQKVSIPESVVLLLERMDLSRGFSNIQNGTSLLPPTSVIQLIVKERENDGADPNELTNRSSQVLWNNKAEIVSNEETKDARPRYKSIKGQYVDEDPEMEFSESEAQK
jgi:hypothetical protein